MRGLFTFADRNKERSDTRMCRMGLNINQSLIITFKWWAMGIRLTNSVVKNKPIKKLRVERTRTTRNSVDERRVTVLLFAVEYSASRPTELQRTPLAACPLL